jgi:hypothetical protein
VLEFIAMKFEVDGWRLARLLYDRVAGAGRAEQIGFQAENILAGRK